MTDDFPPISMSAHPVAHERREEIVTSGLIRQPPSVVWDALVSPADVGQWLGSVGDSWAKQGASAVLDFEDGEFFWCRFETATPPTVDGAGRLAYRWRWNGVGLAAEVDWQLFAAEDSTMVTVTETLVNGPSDWRSWNGMGWPGIIDQLAQYLEMRVCTRWPWRRMGPYVQYLIPCPTFTLWPMLVSNDTLPFWMGRMSGSLEPDDPMAFMIGDASGVATLEVTRRMEPNQSFPSYQPSLAFDIRREGSPGPLQGYLWLEPASLGTSILQVFMSGWEKYGPLNRAPVDRKLFTDFWIGAFRRLGGLVAPPDSAGPPPSDGAGPGPHGWST